MIKLALHVTPKSSRDEVLGWRGNELIVRVTAAPENGKANAAAAKVVAGAFGLPRTAARVVRGATSRHKILQIEGVSEGDVDSVFGTPDDRLF